MHTGGFCQCKGGYVSDDKDFTNERLVKTEACMNIILDRSSLEVSALCRSSLGMLCSDMMSKSLLTSGVYRYQTMHDERTASEYLQP